ncbi:hypothetical protein [Enterovibrio norvegicus]|uniref:hypothetical protein n=1 Tax=Enterovibrio norvegicus TaxID=188144 RepID=UPI000C81C961|nr:hypothetical protein [Enterovibrio norvegicus]PMH69089.1 hypothetical protein BCU62_25340 [Enterovibrio norvegicus]
MLSFSVALPSPYMTYEEYARFSGMSFRLVKDWALEGKIITAPKINKGDTPLVNVVAMMEKASREANQILGHRA